MFIKMRFPAFLLFVLMMLAGCSGGKHDNALSDQELARQIQECSRIYTSEYQVSKIVVNRDDKRIKGKLLGIDLNIGIAGTERVVAIPIKGVLKGYVDLSTITEKNIVRHGDSIEIILPDPKIELTSTAISAKEIKEKTGILRSDYSDAELTAIEQRGRDSLIAEIPRLGLMENARMSAARILIPLLEQTGYDRSKIRVTFSSAASTLNSPGYIGSHIIETKGSAK